MSPSVGSAVPSIATSTAPDECSPSLGNPVSVSTDSFSNSTSSSSDWNAPPTRLSLGVEVSLFPKFLYILEEYGEAGELGKDWAHDTQLALARGRLSRDRDGHDHAQHDRGFRDVHAQLYGLWFDQTISLGLPLVDLSRI